MLGKVFENLIEENRRKGLGAFYTPREIVHFMCRESLINYLDDALNRPAKPRAGQSIVVPRKDVEDWIRQSDQFAHYAAAIAAGTKGDHYPKPPKTIHRFAAEIDALLRDITVCDPAIGSGAFPVGMMTEVVRVRVALTPYFNDQDKRTPYHFKRHAIQNSLYGVDIDVGAVETAKLRLWLSLVVDEDDVQQIKPLPNLDYTIVVGNSLLGFPFKSQRIQRIETLKAEYFDETDHEKKKRLVREIDSELAQAFANSKGSLGYEVTFDFEINFSEVFCARGGFDIIIANPPYLKERDNKQVFDVVTSTPWGKKYHEGKMDYWFFFLHRALELTRAAGIVSFITSRYWLNSSGSTKLIEHIRLKAAIFHAVDIGKLRVFEQVAGHHMLHFYRSGAEQSLCLVKTLEGSLDDIAAFEPSDHLRISEQTAADLFTANGEMRLYKATLSLATVLTVGERYEVTQGVVQNPDRVSAVMARRYCLPQGNGVFVLEPTELAALRLSAAELSYVRPFYDESAVRRFHLQRSASNHLLYLTKKNCPTLRSLPNLARHLAPYREIMDARRETVKGTIKWFQLHWPRDPRYFESPKVVLPSMFSVPNAAYVPEPAYFGLGSNVVIGGDKSFSLKLLCALLNSKVGAWWFDTNGKKRGSGVDVGVDRLRQFPLPKASTGLAEVEKLVDWIIAAKANTPNADVSGAEQKMDALIYGLYGLSEDDIRLLDTPSEPSSEE
jgi:Eco57I restriction-modification methylase/TaqI-like C-terminal specificity domain